VLLAVHHRSEGQGVVLAVRGLDMDAVVPTARAALRFAASRSRTSIVSSAGRNRSVLQLHAPDVLPRRGWLDAPNMSHHVEIDVYALRKRPDQMLSRDSRRKRVRHSPNDVDSRR
jgi:hypothetical protein